MLNAHASLVARLGTQTLKDIEGLNPDKTGFCRSECCDPLPSKLVGSFEPLTSHLFLSTDLVAPQWSSKADNVVGYSDLSKRVSQLDDASKWKVTVFHRPGPDSVNVLFKYDALLRAVVITQYSCVAAGVLPWEAKGVVACDRTDEIFIFVCSHRVRDERCGYCGPVIVDVLRAAVATKFGPDANIYVSPCSHVGGHTYAGNVLVYSKHGGVCFGCFCPSDVDALVEALADKMHQIPQVLQKKVRGTMGTAYDPK